MSTGALHEHLSLMSLVLGQSCFKADRKRLELDNANLGKASTKIPLMLMLSIHFWKRFTVWSYDKTDPLVN